MPSPSRILSCRLDLPPVRSTSSSHRAQEGQATSSERTSQPVDPVPGSEDLLAASPPPAILIFDALGNLLWADHGAVRMTGVPVEALTGRAWRDCVHEQDLDRLMATWDRGVDAGAPFAIDIRLVVPAGADHWVHGEVIPIPLEGGAANVRVAVVTDLVAERQVVARARTLDRLTETVFRNAPVGIEVFGADGTAIAVNPALLRLIGIPEDAPIVGRFNPLTDPITSGMRSDFLRAFDGETVATEAVIPLGDAAFDRWGSTRTSPTIHQVLVPIPGDDGAVDSVVAFVWDVTDERAATARQVALERELAEARHLESLATLAGGIAHDFNNLHAAILGHAALARREVATDGVAAGDLDQIEVAARRAGDLARQLLAYSGRVQVSLDRIDAAALVRQAMATIEARLDGHDVLLDLSPEAGSLRGDAGQLRQVIRSIVINAAEAIPEGERGCITVTSGAIDAGGRGATVFIEIADRGAGMAPETRNRLFDPFFSTKAVGRGLGMAAVDGVVRAHGGRVEVSTTLGAGTRVRILLPSAPVEPTTPARAPARGGLSILVVEDEPALARLAVRVLEGPGFRVAVAADGTEALACLGDESVPIDVVLLDLTLPAGVTGVEVFEAVGRLRPGTPIIVSSGWSASDVDIRVGGYASFLQKPYHPDALVAAINGAIGAPSPVPRAGPR